MKKCFAFLPYKHSCLKILFKSNSVRAFLHGELIVYQSSRAGVCQCVRPLVCVCVPTLSNMNHSETSG